MFRQRCIRERRSESDSEMHKDSLLTDIVFRKKKLPRRNYDASLFLSKHLFTLHDGILIQTARFCITSSTQNNPAVNTSRSFRLKVQTFVDVLIRTRTGCYVLFLSHHWLAVQGYRGSTKWYLPSACWWELRPRMLFHHLPWQPHGFSGLSDFQRRWSKDVGDRTQVPDGGHQRWGLTGQKTKNPWPISFIHTGGGENILYWLVQCGDISAVTILNSESSPSP